MTFETHRVVRPKSRASRRQRFIPGVVTPLAAACFLALAGCEPENDVSSVTDTTIEDEAITDTAMKEDAWRSQVSPDYREPEIASNGLPPGYPHTRQDEGVMGEDTAPGDLADDRRTPRDAEDFAPQTEMSAVADVQSVGNSALDGQLELRQEEDLVRITGQLSGLEPGAHGLFLRENGSCDDADPADAAGEDAAAEGDSQGTPGEGAGESESLGNFVVAEDGSATVDISDANITLAGGPNSVVGKTLIVQATEMEGAAAQPYGGSGDPLGCAEILVESFAQATGP